MNNTPKLGDLVNGEIVVWVARDGSGFETQAVRS